MKLDRLKLVIGGLGALALVIALAGFLFVLQPQRSKVASLDAQIATAQAQYASLHAGGGTKPSVHAAELFQLARALPDTPDVPGLLLQLSQMADRTGVTLVGVRPQVPTVLTNGATAIPLQVTVDSTWSGLTKFLAALRRQVVSHGARLSVAGRLFDVDAVQVATVPATSTAGAPKAPIETQLTVNAFVYGVPAPVAPTTTGPTDTTSTTTTSSTSSSQQAAGATGGAGS